MGRVGGETQIFAGTQIDNFEMSFRIIALPFLTGYTRERCKEQEIGIERLIGEETEKTYLSSTQIKIQIFASTQIDNFEM